jgi:enoyl-CoA hydratase/carnithine racemase
MSADQVVTIEKKNGVGIVTFNRPTKANALNHELKAGITEALNQLKNDKELGAILLRGAGKHFCAGQDFNDVVLGTDQRILRNAGTCFPMQ